MAIDKLNAITLPKTNIAPISNRNFLFQGAPILLVSGKVICLINCLRGIYSKPEVHIQLQPFLALEGHWHHCRRGRCDLYTRWMVAEHLAAQRRERKHLKM